MDIIWNIIGTVMLIASGFGFLWVLSDVLADVFFED